MSPMHEQVPTVYLVDDDADLLKALARLLLDVLSGEAQSVRHVTLPHRLVVRGSTGPARR